MTYDLAMILYTLSVCSLGVYALNKTTSLFSKTKRRRLKWLKRRGLETIATESAPFEEAELKAKQHAQGVEAIESQFTVAQTLTLPLISLMILIAMGIPFLPRVPAATLSAFLAIITLVLGMTGRPFLENAAAGMILSSSKLIRLGDTVEVDGFYGTVEDISATHTTLKVWDWRRVIKPNLQMLNHKVVNHSLPGGYLWASIDFHVQSSCDITLFEEALLSRLGSCHYRVSDTEIEMWVMELELYSVRCRVAAWANNATDAFYLREEMNRVVSKLRVELGVAPHSLHLTPSQMRDGEQV